MEKSKKPVIYDILSRRKENIVPDSDLDSSGDENENVLTDISNVATYNSLPSTSCSLSSCRPIQNIRTQNSVTEAVGSSPLLFTQQEQQPQLNSTQHADDYIPDEILKRAENARNKLLPYKSKPKYLAAYDHFMKWKESHKLTSMVEPVFLAYFEELSSTRAPNTLLSHYSMLRSTLQAVHNINIHSYGQIIQFLTNNAKGYIPKKANVLGSEHVLQFLKEAPNDKYLATKVAFVFGLLGACRKHELVDLLIDHIKDKGDMVVVEIPVTKNDKPRRFVVTEEFYPIYKEYANLRPKDVETKRFFLCLRDGKCIKQPIGINTIGLMPREAAKFLKLENPETYTGHTFRRTSTTLLADAGGSKEDCKRHGGWKSDAVVEGYIADSIGNKKKIGGMITTKILGPAPKRPAIEHRRPTFTDENRNPLTTQNSNQLMSMAANKTINLQITNCNNITLNLGNDK